MKDIRPFLNTCRRNTVLLPRPRNTTTSVVESILTSAIFVQQSYRACQGIIRLTDRYGNDRVESACKILEPKSAATYKRVKTILENNMDLHPSDNTQALQSYIPHNDNVRGAGAYQ